MTLQGGGETRCGIGTRLRAGRERKGFTVLQAAEKMHVDAKILESLEAEDFDALGAPVFVRGHLRHYAELVGEQAAELLTLYVNSMRAALPDLTRIPKAEPPRDTRRMVIPAVVVLLGFAIAGAVWWVVTLPKGHSRAAQVQALPAAPKLAANDPLSSGALHAPSGSAAPTSPATQQLAAAATNKSATAPANAKLATPAGAPATTVAPDGAARATRQAELTLRFTAESWAEVYDSAGQRLFYDVGPAESVKTFKGTPPLRIVLGNAPGVAVEVNGHTTHFASLTHPDGSAQFMVNRSGHATGAP